MTVPADKPKNEAQRLKNLQDLLVLDTPSEALFDEITKLASIICDTPIALISLIDENRQWFKANIGFEGTTETDRDMAFCSHTILKDQVFEVQNATLDDRFKNNPLVTQAPHINFYAGAPIAMPSGENIGAICVISQKPHALSDLQKSMLTGLANTISKALISRREAINETRNNANKLAAIVESSSDAILSKDLDSIVTSWNKGAEMIFGYSASEMIGESITCLFPEALLAEEQYLVHKIKNGEAIRHFETQRLTKSGALIDLSVNLSPIKNAIGELVGIAIIGRDITAKKQLEKSFFLQHERLRVTMQSIGDAVITTNTQCEIEYLNPVAESLTGWKLADAQGKPITEVFNIIDETNRERAIDPVYVCLSENKTVGLATHTLLISKDGTEYGIEDSAAPIRDEKQNILGAVLVFHDVTEQRKMASEMTYRATHDALTGLFNRREFEHKLDHSLITAHKNHCEHALMFIDLDQFKIINDTCGHTVGDKLLKSISHIMLTHLRNSDMLGRLGGDEFGILLENCSLEPALRIAENICKDIDNYRFTHHNQRFAISASIGLLIFNEKWKSIEHLMQSADTACYAAKESGRNRVHIFYDSDYSLESRKGSAYWASRITQALEENRFVLYHQLIIPLTKGMRVKSEILLRMLDEKGHLVSPGTFLPAAEKFHLISRIDKWVVNAVFTWLKQHQKQLAHIGSIAINLSGQSISDHTFHEYVLERIESLELDCTNICFEITETAAITNLSAANTFINSMQKQHIRFALDDFGSGVSSFGHLKSLPIDYLKIDGQFIKELVNNDIDRATVRCILEVAKVTGKLTIAEWVETEEVEALLQQMGVDYVQGFLRHKPAPLAHLLSKETVSAVIH